MRDEGVCGCAGAYAANDTSGDGSFSKFENWKLWQALSHCDNVSRKFGLCLIRPAERLVMSSHYTPTGS